MIRHATNRNGRCCAASTKQRKANGSCGAPPTGNAANAANAISQHQLAAANASRSPTGISPLNGQPASAACHSRSSRNKWHALGGSLAARKGSAGRGRCFDDAMAASRIADPVSPRRACPAGAGVDGAAVHVRTDDPDGLQRFGSRDGFRISVRAGRVPRSDDAPIPAADETDAPPNRSARPRDRRRSNGRDPRSTPLELSEMQPVSACRGGRLRPVHPSTSATRSCRFQP